VETGESIASPFKGHEDTVNSVAFSPTGGLIASCSTDATIRLWPANNIAGGTNGETASGTIRGHAQGVNSVAFSPDGNLLASSSDDNTVRFWDCETKAEHAKIDTAMVLRDVRFSTDRSIETDRGALVVGTSVLGISSLSLNGGLCTSLVTEEWVMKEQENALWLPDDYRATSVVTEGGFTVLGHSSGSISFISLR
jgi:WD40 repeat protein